MLRATPAGTPSVALDPDPLEDEVRLLLTSSDSSTSNVCVLGVGGNVIVGALAGSWGLLFGALEYIISAIAYHQTTSTSCDFGDLNL